MKIEKIDRILWIAAVVLFVVGDLVTTWVGLYHLGAVERNPIPAMLIAEVGFWVLIAAKVALVAAFYGVYRVSAAYVAGNRPARMALSSQPALIGAAGAVATIHNINVLAAAF